MYEGNTEPDNGELKQDVPGAQYDGIDDTLDFSKGVESSGGSSNDIGNLVDDLGPGYQANSSPAGVPGSSPDLGEGYAPAVLQEEQSETNENRYSAMSSEQIRSNAQKAGYRVADSADVSTVKRDLKLKREERKALQAEKLESFKSGMEGLMDKAADYVGIAAVADSVHEYTLNKATERQNEQIRSHIDEGISFYQDRVQHCEAKIAHGRNTIKEMNEAITAGKMLLQEDTRLYKAAEEELTKLKKEKQELSKSGRSMEATQVGDKIQGQRDALEKLVIDFESNVQSLELFQDARRQVETYQGKFIELRSEALSERADYQRMKSVLDMHDRFAEVLGDSYNTMQAGPGLDKSSIGDVIQWKYDDQQDEIDKDPQLPTAKFQLQRSECDEQTTPEDRDEELSRKFRRLQSNASNLT